MKKDYYAKSSTLKSLIFGIILLSSATMSLNAQSLTIQSPNGGEVWTYGQSETITWTGINLSNEVMVYFSYDGGTNWWSYGLVPSGPNGGSATVGVPNVQTTNAIFNLTDVINPDATDMSDDPFTVYVPPIIVYEPSPNFPVFAESDVYVYWNLTVFDFPYLNAELSVDNGVTYALIAENIDAHSGGYTYLYLSDTPADSCILKLYNSSDPTEFGLSEVFTISPLPAYNLVSPAAGELVNTYSPYTINWTVENPYSEYAYLEYSIDNGQTWEVINNVFNEGNSGSYEWFTPNVDSEECLVRITDSYALTSMDTSGMFSIFTFPETPICMVSVDSLTNYNVIIWERPVSDIIADFLVYKETDEFNVYEVIDTVGYEEMTMVTDAGSNPAIRPYRYKIGFIDVENRLFPASDYHQTIHLTINQGVNGAWNLIWTPYTGFEYPSYKIMRKSDSGAYDQIASVSASFSSYTDLNAPMGEVYYMIKIEHPDGCNPATRDGEYASVYSNVASNSIVSVSENKNPDFTVYPIPADKQLNVSFGENITGNARLVISDLTGRVVYSEELNDVRPGQVKPISSSNFTEGIYLLQLISGEIMTTKKIAIRR
jgi:hypothetical protein